MSYSFFMIGDDVGRILSATGNSKNRYDKYHKGNWHYADTFWAQENNQAKTLPKPAKKAVKAVEKLSDEVLKDNSASNADKVIALA